MEFGERPAAEGLHSANGANWYDHAGMARIVTDPLTMEGPEGPEAVAVAGDWHGRLQQAERAIRWAHQYEQVRTIVHAGDFGFWRDTLDTRLYLEGVSRLLLELDMVLLFVDGNHEDHARLNLWPLDAYGLRPINERIWHVPRGFRWAWHGKTWLGVGGAHSVDRQQRTPYLDWWPEESLRMKDVLRIQAEGKADIMICHDAPEGARVPVLMRKSRSIPEVDLMESAAHREMIRDIVDVVKPALLLHGHYHCAYEDRLSRQGGETQVIGLDQGHLNSPIRDNVRIVHLKERMRVSWKD